MSRKINKEQPKRGRVEILKRVLLLLCASYQCLYLLNVSILFFLTTLEKLLRREISISSNNLFMSPSRYRCNILINTDISLESLLFPQ